MLFPVIFDTNVRGVERSRLNFEIARRVSKGVLHFWILCICNCIFNVFIHVLLCCVGLCVTKNSNCNEKDHLHVHVQGDLILQVEDRIQQDSKRFWESKRLETSIVYCPKRSLRVCSARSARLLTSDISRSIRL